MLSWPKFKTTRGAARQGRQTLAHVLHFRPSPRVTGPGSYSELDHLSVLSLGSQLPSYTEVGPRLFKTNKQKKLGKMYLRDKLRR